MEFLKKHIKNLEKRVRRAEELENRIKSLEMFIFRIEFIEAQLENFSNIISDIQNKPEKELLEYFFNRLIEEAEMSDMPFEKMWERIGNYFCERYESKITQMTEETQRQLAMICLARMELITQQTISKLEKLSKESIEMVKNKESKNE